MRTIFLALLLGGCTTMAGVQERPVIASYASAKSTAELEECLVTNLSWMGVPAVMRGSSTVLIYGNPNPAFTLTLTGASVDVRAGIARPGARLNRNVEACA